MKKERMDTPMKRFFDLGKQNPIQTLGIMVVLLGLFFTEGCSNTKRQDPVYPFTVCLPDDHQMTEAFILGGPLREMEDLHGPFILEDKDGFRCKRFGIRLLDGPIQVVVIPKNRETVLRKLVIRRLDCEPDGSCRDRATIINRTQDDTFRFQIDFDHPDRPPLFVLGRQQNQSNVTRNVIDDARYDQLFQNTVGSFGYDWRILKALAFIESGFDPKARMGSSQGLLQVNSTQCRDLGLDTRINCEDLFNPTVNTIVGGHLVHFHLVRILRACPEADDETGLRLLHIGLNHGSAVLKHVVDQGACEIEKQEEAVRSYSSGNVAYRQLVSPDRASEKWRYGEELVNAYRRFGGVDVLPYK
jgi:hypothetical protein